MLSHQFPLSKAVAVMDTSGITKIPYSRNFQIPALEVRIVYLIDTLRVLAILSIPNIGDR